MLPRYSRPEGQEFQAFTFALDPTPEQAIQITRFFGARRKAFNWTLDQIKGDIERYRETGESTIKPSFYSLRKRWNADKSSIRVNAETGEIWWPKFSKEVFADGVRGATDAYWHWQKSRAGKTAGRSLVIAPQLGPGGPASYLIMSWPILAH
ncbi:MAG TPA: helix-turn-helix domain-containing protein [Acidimicrobiales bacterium]|nr:helix-turn-helix domain-containing protein [Acidimicrobiales bacterium]